MSESLHKLLYPRNPEELGLIAGGVSGAMALIWYMVRRRRVSAEEMERRRRVELAATGRIIDGIIVDAPLYHAEELAQGAPALIASSYRIAGVVYECSQDVSTLQTEIGILPHRPAGLHQVRPAQSGEQHRGGRRAGAGCAPAPRSLRQPGRGKHTHHHT